ncbi:hypothetical protein D9758_011044 [Tetrapyrgos nigripes]|uniref:DUF4402 domain-containing protein n=1 Tax=Tetrapyrgos nigripes TaxID=182062 RepID=A0A8H5CV64_9AGAR|nr:hypothetical protein D9758_011044 [Tetrapyrgos nigripes]
MKLSLTTPFVFLAAMSLTTPALAQIADFLVPANGDTLKAGSVITVEIEAPLFSAPVREVGLVIGFTVCNRLPLGCTSSPEELMETVLYNGTFNPQRDPLQPTKQAHQNFTVTLPDGQGAAQMGLVHFALGEGEEHPRPICLYLYPTSSIYTMKFTAPLVFLAAMATSVFAQNAEFGVPANGANLAAGSSITVEVDVPTPPTPFQDIAIAIGVTMCEQFTCTSPEEFMQFLLYNGTFNPQRDPQERTKPAHQNFTLTLPNQKGPAQLGLVHFGLGFEAVGFTSVFRSDSVDVTLT